MQRMMQGELWNEDISVHITPQVGINVLYPSDLKRPHH